MRLCGVSIIVVVTIFCVSECESDADCTNEGATGCPPRIMARCDTFHHVCHCGPRVRIHPTPFIFGMFAITINYYYYKSTFFKFLNEIHIKEQNCVKTTIPSACITLIVA